MRFSKSLCDACGGEDRGTIQPFSYTMGGTTRTFEACETCRNNLCGIVRDFFVAHDDLSKAARSIFNWEINSPIVEEVRKKKREPKRAV